MYLQKAVGQALVKLFESRMCKQRISGSEVKLEVLIHTLYIYHVIQCNPHISIVHLEKKGIQHTGWLRHTGSRHRFLQIIGSTLKIFKPEWLQQIVDSTYLITVNSIL